MNYIRFGVRGPPQPYEFISFCGMDDTKLYEFIKFRAMDVTNPYELYRVWGHGWPQSL